MLDLRTLCALNFVGFQTMQIRFVDLQLSVAVCIVSLELWGGGVINTYMYML